MRTLFSVVALTIVFSSTPGIADTVEVAPGVRVTKKTYPAPETEQPFFGFANKTPAQIAADEKFTSQIVQLSGSRQRALEESLKRGWSSLLSGDAISPTNLNSCEPTTDVFF